MAGRVRAVCQTCGKRGDTAGAKDEYVCRGCTPDDRALIGGRWVITRGIRRWVADQAVVDRRVQLVEAIREGQEVAKVNAESMVPAHVTAIVLRLMDAIPPAPLATHRICRCGCLCLPREVCPNCLTGDAIYEREEAA